MARETPEVRDDPSPHAPLKRRMLLAKLLLEADPTWLIERALFIKALQAFIGFCRSEFYGPLLDDKKRTDLLEGNDKVQLRAHAVSVGSTVAVGLVDNAFSASPVPA